MFPLIVGGSLYFASIKIINFTPCPLFLFAFYTTLMLQRLLAVFLLFLSCFIAFIGGKIKADWKRDCLLVVVVLFELHVGYWVTELLALAERYRGSSADRARCCDRYMW